MTSVDPDFGDVHGRGLIPATSASGRITKTSAGLRSARASAELCGEMRGIGSARGGSVRNAGQHVYQTGPAGALLDEEAVDGRVPRSQSNRCARYDRDLFVDSKRYGHSRLHFRYLENRRAHRAVHARQFARGTLPACVATGGPVDDQTGSVERHRRRRRLQERECVLKQLAIGVQTNRSGVSGFNT